jgi:hypothetical protein
MKYRKKPVVIEAIQYNVRNIKECLEFIGSSARKHGNWHQVNDLVIATLEGDMFCKNGDYIIKGIKGEFYPCKPDIFEATYERVESE